MACREVAETTQDRNNARPRVEPGRALAREKPIQRVKLAGAESRRGEFGKRVRAEPRSSNQDVHAD